MDWILMAAAILGSTDLDEGAGLPSVTFFFAPPATGFLAVVVEEDLEVEGFDVDDVDEEGAGFFAGTDDDDDLVAVLLVDDDDEDDVFVVGFIDSVFVADGLTTVGFAAVAVDDGLAVFEAVSLVDTFLAGGWSIKE